MFASTVVSSRRQNSVIESDGGINGSSDVTSSRHKDSCVQFVIQNLFACLIFRSCNFATCTHDLFLKSLRHLHVGFNRIDC